jgi:hypothetical protein
MSDTLLVCAPGLRYGLAKWEPLLDFIKSNLGIEDADILRWEHHCSYLSTAYAEQLSRSLAAEVDAKSTTKKQSGSEYTKHHPYRAQHWCPANTAGIFNCPRQ